MPWPVYTERFFHHQAAGHWLYTVPAGRRAVITNIDVLGQAAGATSISIAVGPIFATLILIPAPDVTHHEVCKIVAYAGEVVDLHINVSGTHCNVTGSLFDDPSGAGGPPGGLAYERDRAPAPLPSEGGVC